MRRTTHLLYIFCAALEVHHAAAEGLRMDAKDLFEAAVTHNVRLSQDGRAIELAEDELIEDDGPAAGFSYQPNEERLSETVWIRKELLISDPRARKATLLVAPGGSFKAVINGKPVELQQPEKAGGYWQSYAISPEVLRPGANEIVLYGNDKIWIARADEFAAGSDTHKAHPNRSAKSSDGGKTWDRDRLGHDGKTDGEYYVRLFLDHYQPSGSLTLPVLDAGNLSNHAIAPHVSALGALRVVVESESGAAGKIIAKVRSGPTPSPDAKTWSAWQEIRVGKVLSDVPQIRGAGGELASPKGRYFQVALELSTTDALQTPQLKSVRIEASPRKAGDWISRLKVTESHNEKIVRSSIPFAYEPFDHPRLAELRKAYQLDKIVEGAKDEFEIMTCLAVWSARQFDHGHLKEAYPPWDALEILKAHADGQPVGGFCQQYNVVLLQACESFGIPGRAVSIGVGDHSVGGQSTPIRGGGHEVVELWSNQFKKWVYIDGNMGWYAVDGKSGVPLSLWELRQRQLEILRGESTDPTRIVELQQGGKRWSSLAEWPPFLELRLIPRSNFLEKQSPLPLNQGMRGWFWTGHHVWTDEDYPASLLYGNRIDDRRNWEWTLNQAHFTLEATATPGELRVHLETQTPSFETFLAETDGQHAMPVTSGFVWKLRPGKNRLEVRPRNITGREGIRSYVMIEKS